MGGFDSPLVEAIRSGLGKSDADKFASLIHAFIDKSGPPSGSEAEPWVDSDDPAEDYLDGTKTDGFD
jgi:hypothetical protein